MTTQEIDKLFADTLLGDYDDDAPWKAVSQLRTNGDRTIFEKASVWCGHSDPKHRARGADILGQLRAPKILEQNATILSDPIFIEESFQILSGALFEETDENAIVAQLFALGHLYKPEVVAILIRYSNHSNEDIRFAVACSLGHFHEDPAAIEHLSKLADDPDGDVRNWALFALGTQSNFDSAELRNLFVRHTQDPHEDAQQEAIAGLCKRSDSRGALPLLRLMQSGSYFSHLHDDFMRLFVEPQGTKSNTEDYGKWGTEDFIDALYQRYPYLLPSRSEASNN